MSERDTAAIGILASGNGSTFEAVYDAIQEKGIPNTEIAYVICNNGEANPKAGIWERARRLGIDIHHVSNLTEAHCSLPEVNGAPVGGTISYEASERMVELAHEYGIKMYVALGFMKKVIGPVLQTIPIGNSHPGPLPATAGAYADGVQEAVMRKCLEFSGPTFHWMDTRIDGHGLPMYDSGEQIGHEPVRVTHEMQEEWRMGGTVTLLKNAVMDVEKQMVPVWIQRALEQL